jgi:hypothetical protein
VSESGGAIYLFGVTPGGAVDEITGDGGSWQTGNVLSVGSDKYANDSALGLDLWASNGFNMFGADNSGQIKNVFNYGSGPQYAYTSDTDSVLTPIDPNSTFTAGTMLTAYTDGNSAALKSRFNETCARFRHSCQDPALGLPATKKYRMPPAGANLHRPYGPRRASMAYAQYLGTTRHCW